MAAVIILLEAGAVDSHIDGFGRSSLALAAEAGHEDMVVELLRRGSLSANFSVGVDGITTLHLAVAEGHRDCGTPPARRGRCAESSIEKPRSTSLRTRQYKMQLPSSGPFWPSTHTPLTGHCKQHYFLLFVTPPTGKTPTVTQVRSSALSLRGEQIPTTGPTQAYVPLRQRSSMTTRRPS